MSDYIKQVYLTRLKPVAVSCEQKLELLLDFLAHNENSVISKDRFKEFLDLKDLRPIRFIMGFETDWDFSIHFKGKIYAESEFSIYLSSVEELDEIRVLGPFGSPSKGGKIYAVDEALREIKANPDEHFSNMGGNRGVSWTPLRYGALV